MNALRALLLATLLAIAMLALRDIGPVPAAAVWVLCLVVLARSHTHRMLSFACLYLLLLGIFHLGFVVPVALGLTHVERPAWLSSSRLPLSIGLFTVATLAFTLGARAGARRGDEDAPIQPQAELFLAGAAVATAGAAMLWVGVVRLGVLSGGYGEYFERMLTQDVRLFWFGLMVFPIGLLVAAVAATRFQMMLLGLALLAALGPLFLVGFRGPVIVQAASLLAVWAHKDRRVAKRVSGAVVVAALVLAPAIRVAREIGVGGAASTAGSVDPVAMLLEAGGSLHPLVVTAERIDGGSEDLWWGRSYATAVNRVLLNASAHRDETSTLTPSAWATLNADTWAYEHGYGIGFSGVAEPYLNFGLVGVAVVFLLMGIVVQRWERWLQRDPFRAAIGAASFGFLLWTVRNDVMDVFRAIALSTATVLAAWILYAVRRRGGAPARTRQCTIA